MIYVVIILAISVFMAFVVGMSDLGEEWDYDDWERWLRREDNNDRLIR